MEGYCDWAAGLGQTNICLPSSCRHRPSAKGKRNRNYTGNEGPQGNSQTMETFNLLQLEGDVTERETNKKRKLPWELCTSVPITKTTSQSDRRQAISMHAKPAQLSRIKRSAFCRFLWDWRACLQRLLPVALWSATWLFIAQHSFS